MLPIQRAEVRYPDGSVFRIPEDGAWAQAPAFGVQCVVYYHVADPDGLQRRTYDGGDKDDVFVWEGGGHLAGVKMGLWQSAQGFYRVQDLALRRTLPEVE